MRIKKVVYKSNQRFCGSQAEVSKARSEFTGNKRSLYGDVKVEEIEVKTGKQDILKFINELSEARYTQGFGDGKDAYEAKPDCGA